MSTGRTKAQETARKVAIALSWLISFGVLPVTLTTRVPQWVIIAVFFLGFAPYILCIRIIEPWLGNRQE